MGMCVCVYVCVCVCVCEDEVFIVSMRVLQPHSGIVASAKLRYLQ